MQSFVFWIALGTIILAYMSAWYGLALVTDRYDVVDSAWGLGFILVAWISLGIRANFDSLQVVSAVLVSIWGLRLFTHLANRNWRKDKDDTRYQALRSKWGAAANRKAYTHIFLLQGVLLLLISTPMIAIAFSHHQPNAVTYLGWIIWAGGIAFETIADRQLATFLSTRPGGSHQIMDRGLWRYSRHPNYFGEIVSWWGAAITAVSAGGWWGVAGALVIIYLITRVSGIPPLEKRYDDNKDYAAYRHHTSVLVPLPPKRVG